MLGYDLQDLCCQGPIDRLSRTDFTQPALLAASVGMFRVLRREGLRFDVAIGHSLGEFSALVATGAVAFEDALRIVRRRGQEMLPPPTPTRAAWPPCSGWTTPWSRSCAPSVDGVWPANFNCPGQVVVSGAKAAMEALAEKARAAGAKRVISLPVSGAFHSPLVEPALAPLREEFETTDLAHARPRRSSPAARSSTRPATSASCCSYSSSRRCGSPRQ